MLKYRAHIEDTESNLDISNNIPDEEHIIIEHDTLSLENDIREYDDLSSAIDTGLEVNKEYINMCNSINTIDTTDDNKVIDICKHIETSIRESLFKLGYKEEFVNYNNNLHNEAFSNNIDRLHYHQEDLKERILNIVESVTNMFRKIVSWFKTMTAKFITTFNSNESKAKNLFKEASKKKATLSNMPDKEEISVLYKSKPIVGLSFTSGNAVVGLSNRACDPRLLSSIDTMLRASFEILNQANSIVKKGENVSEREIADAADNIARIVNNGLESVLGKLVKLIGFDTGKYIKNNVADGVSMLSVLIRYDGKKPKYVSISYDADNVKNLIAQCKQPGDINASMTALSQLVNSFEMKPNNKIELEEDELLKAMPDKLLTLQDIKSVIRTVEANSKKSVNFTKTILSKVEKGGTLAQTMRGVAIVNERAAGTSFLSAAMNKAINISKVTATNIAVDICVNNVKVQSAILELVAKNLKYYDNI